MRIVHVITRLILGGAQENTLLTCEGLHARGHEVTLITGPAIGPEGQLLDRAFRGGYRVIVLDAMRREVNPLRDLSTYRQLVRRLRELRPDVMHSHSSKAGILARRAARRAGVPIIVHTVHGLPFHPFQPWWYNALYVAMERRAARQSNAIVSVCDAMTRQALAAGVGRAEQYTTIYSGMEVSPFLTRPTQADAFRASLNLPPGALLATQVSRLAELKGHDYIIDAARHLDARIHFAFVGDGHWRQRLLDRVEQERLAGRFHFTGLLPPEQIPAVLHASDLLVHCSLREGLARALPQAMLSGLPVVSFDVDGAREVVFPGQTGYLLAAKNVPGLIAALTELANDESLRRRLGECGRQRVREQFSAETMVEQIEGLYQALRVRPNSRTPYG